LHKHQALELHQPVLHQPVRPQLRAPLGLPLGLLHLWPLPLLLSAQQAWSLVL
jgi:hypothetical protein